MLPAHRSAFLRGDASVNMRMPSLKNHRQTEAKLSSVLIAPADTPQMTEKTEFRQDFSYGWQRARVLGAFFNGAFLLALGFGIMLHAIERFVSLEHIDHIMMVFIMGCVGLGLNLLTATFLHGRFIPAC
jgi:Co/Zn/Cd efflux system component